MNNPLLLKFNTPLNTIPFQEIKLEHYQPAVKEAIMLGKQDIDSIKKNSASPNFNNTIEALERSAKQLELVTSIFFNLNSSETSDEMQQIAQEISPVLTAFADDILMDETLFNKVKQVYDTVDKTILTTEQAMLLDKTYKNFLRNGANLNDQDKTTLKNINTRIAISSLKFGENLLKDSNNFELHIVNKNELKGLPDGVVEAAHVFAMEKGKKEGWLFNLDYPSYLPFMMYSEVRELRKHMYLAFNSRAFKDNDYNNERLVKELSELRHEKALLLGYKSHADLVLEERMAEKPGKVYELLNELLKYAKPVAIEELKEIQELANKMGGASPIDRWDFSFYSEKLKNEKFAISDEILKPYFKLENVVEGVFKTAEKLYGIVFEKREDIQKYHKDVITYQVKDEQGKHLAVFYADFFPRASKRNGAWMTAFMGQNKYDGNEQRPLVSIVCNFTKPTPTKPSLLTFDEVTTLFHEFGHALHGMLADGYYESLSGTSVYWDFVELPSQIMENWCYEKECLDMFAKHYQTNEPIPMELIKKIKDSANFLSGYQSVRQVGLGRLDMSWHDLSETHKESVAEVEEKATKETDLFPPLKGINTSCAFSHIFNGGYSSGYYSYKWAEVLEADAFEYFIETGIFSKATADKFKKNILSKGGSEHPMELYKKFRGQEPSIKPLLKKGGLLKQ